MAVRWVRAAAALSRRTLEGTLVRIGPETVLLSASASALLDVLERPHSAEEAADRLARATGTPAETVRADIDALLTDLAARGVVTSWP
jgi:hypothetical protein